MSPDRLEMVLPEEGTFELVLVTLGEGDRPNAAPVGVRRRSEALMLQLAEGTRSLNNLRIRPEGLLCVIDDPLLIVQAALNEFPEVNFNLVEGLGIPSIAGSAVILGVRMVSEAPVTRIDELGDSVFAALTLEATSITVLRLPDPPSRSLAAALEAAVAVSKAELARRRGLNHLLPRYQDAVCRSREVVRHSGSKSARAALSLCERWMEDLLRGAGEG